MYESPIKTRYILIAQSVTLALCLVYLETLKAMRSSQWGGTASSAWGGLVLGLVIYTCACVALMGVAVWLLRRVKAVGRRPPYAVSIGSALAGALVWGFLSAYREQTPTPDDALILAGILALSLWMLAAPRLMRASHMRAVALVMLVLVAGHVALHSCGVYYLYAPQRAARVTLLPPLWAALTLLTGLALWASSHRGVVSKTVHAAMAILLPVLAVWAATHVSAPAPRADRPNLVLIVSDSLRSDYLSAYGGQVATPNLDALAERGVLFEQSYSLAPWTLPSMTALFRSQYPPGLTPDAGAGVWQAQLYQYGETGGGENLAERLKAEGYATAAFTSNALLPPVPGILDGFDARATSHPILLLRQGLFAYLPFLQDALAGLFPTLDPVRPHDTTLDMTRYTDAFLTRNRDEPFYLWVHYIDPHAPYAPPPRHVDARGRWPFFYPYKGGEAWDIPVLGDPEWAIQADDRPLVQALYEGEVRYIDEAAGRIMDRLRALDLTENTIVCFTSDHGEELWDHGGWGHGQSLYDELVRVPLILSGPGVLPARRAEPVSAIDLMPTLADLAGLAPSPSWRGVSLLDDISGDIPVFAQGTSDKAWPNPYQMVRAGRYKLIREAGSGALTLFDLEADPREEHDRALLEPGVARRLEAMLLEWLGSFDSTFVVESAPEDQGELYENLRGMGYL